MSVYRPKDKHGRFKSPYWHYDFKVTLPDGTHCRFSGSTGLRKKKQAQEFEDQRREDEILGTGPGRLTVNQACWKFWEELGKGYKGDNEKARHLETIRRLLGSNTRLTDLTTEDIADAIRARAAEPIIRMVRRAPKDPADHTLAPRTIGLPSGPTINRSFIKPLAALLRRAESHWNVPVNPRKFPWKDWLRTETIGKGRELAESEEARFWAAAARRPDYQPLLWFVANNGVRVGGALSMKKSLTNLERRETQILKKTKAAGEHWGTLSLSPAAVAVLDTEMRKSNGDEIWTYVVQRGRDRGLRVPITYAALRRATDTIFKRAGITGFRRHDLRHDFGSKLLRLTGNLKLVQNKLHHSSIAVTSAFYAHVQEAEIVSATELVERSRNATGNSATPLPKKASNAR